MATTPDRAPAGAEATTGDSPGPVCSPEHTRNTALWQQWKHLRDTATAASDPAEAATLTAQAERIREEFLLVNSGLVGAAAKRYLISGVSSREDIMQAGMEGLIEAFENWNPDRGAFSTWAHRHIDGRLRREVRRTEFASMSYGDWSARAAVLAARGTLEAELGRKPTYAEIAARTGHTPGLVERVLTPRPDSLDRPVGEDGSATVADLAPAAQMRVHAPLSEAELRRIFGAAVDELDVDADADKSSGPLSLFAQALRTGELDPGEAVVALSQLTADLAPLEVMLFLRRYALDGGDEQTLSELAYQLGVGREILRRREDVLVATLTERLAEVYSTG